MTKARPERRAADRLLKRVRQLQARLDALLRDARALRAEGSARTRHALEITALLRQKRGSVTRRRRGAAQGFPNSRS